MGSARISTAIAGVALFIVIGGSATAASSLINGKKIKSGTITAKQIKNKTITTAKLSPSTVAGLKGATGPAGIPGTPGNPGATGPAGATGQTGPAGTVAPLSVEAYDINTPADTPVIPLTLQVPAGDYTLLAKANFTSHLSGANDLSCTIWTDETDGVDTASETAASTNQTVNLSMMALATDVEKVEVRCWADSGTGFLDDVKLIATPVSSG